MHRIIAKLSLILIILLAFTACEPNNYGVPGGDTTTTVDPATFDIDGFTKYILSEKGLSRSNIFWVENLRITPKPTLTSVSVLTGTTTRASPSRTASCSSRSTAVCRQQLARRYRGEPM